MSKLSVKIPSAPAESYSISVGGGLIKRLTKVLPVLKQASKMVIVTDRKIKKLFGLKLASNLRQQGLRVLLLDVPVGEKSKTQKYKTFLEETMLKNHCDRKAVILALGGGVIGDLAGFVAATYMRGVAYVQIPTTLLAMVDSSLGGKTGIDAAEGKNLIGAFYQPKAVIADIDCLASLPRRQLVNGLVEAVKMFMISDGESFNFTEKNLRKILNGEPKILKQVIGMAVKIKASVVSRDEKEAGERAVLNFGHTIGHSLEKLSGYKLAHGQAVALGILAEAKISANLGILAKNDYNKIEGLLQKLGIDLSRLKRFRPAAIINGAKTDKKSRGGAPRFILLKKLGQVYVNNGQFTHAVSNKLIVKSLRKI